MAVQCKTCGGVYEPVQADSTQYFHACPPLVDLLVQRGDRQVWIAPADLAKDEVPIRDRTRPRPGARDENITQAADGAEPVIKAEGAGVADAPATIDPIDATAPTVGGVR